MLQEEHDLRVTFNLKATDQCIMVHVSLFGNEGSDFPERFFRRNDTKLGYQFDTPELGELWEHREKYEFTSHNSLQTTITEWE